MNDVWVQVGMVQYIKRGTWFTCEMNQVLHITFDTSKLRMQCYVERRQHERNGAKQLDEHVERWASGVFEGITNCVADYTSFVRFALLTENGTVGVKTLNHLALSIDAQVASLDIFLGIVPRATTIIQEERKHDTTHCADHQHTGFGRGAKNDANSDRSQHGYQAGQYHCTQRTTRTDIDTTSIVGINAIGRIFRHNLRISTELATNLFNHTLGG